MNPPEPNPETTEELLRCYRLTGAEAPLRDLISRYLPLVYCAARRRTGNDALAADVAQAVFCDFARQLRSLPVTFHPGGWLLRHTGFLASRAMRSERRRAAREAEAARQSQLEANMKRPPSDFTGLDDALQRLPAADQAILVCKYYEDHDTAEVAARLGISPAAAQKRMERALLRLRNLMPGTPAISAVAGALAVMLSPSASEASVPVSLLPSLSPFVITAAGQPLSGVRVWLQNLSPWPGILTGVAAALALSAIPLVVYAATRSGETKTRQHGIAVSLPKTEPVRVKPATNAPPTAETTVEALVRLVEREGYNRVAWRKAEHLINKLPPAECGEAIVRLVKAFTIAGIRAGRTGPQWWVQLLLHRWKPDAPGSALGYLLPNIDTSLRDGAAMSLCQDWGRNDARAAEAWLNELLADTRQRLLPADCREVVLRRLGYSVLRDLAGRDPGRAAALATSLEEQGVKGLTPSLSNQRIIAEGSSAASDALSLPNHPAHQSLTQILKGDHPAAERRRLVDDLSDPQIRQDMVPMVAREIIQAGERTEAARTADWLLAQAPEGKEDACLRTIIRAWADVDAGGLGAWLQHNYPSTAGTMMDRHASARALETNVPANAAIARALTIRDEALRDSTLAMLVARAQDQDASKAAIILHSPGLPQELAESLRRWLALPP